MSLTSLLNQQATLYPRTGYNKYGRDVSGSGTTVFCRFQNKTRTKLLQTGQIIDLVGDVYLKGDISVSTEDRITINSVSYKIFSVNGSIDGYGNQKLIKCEVQKWQT